MNKEQEMLKNAGKIRAPNKSTTSNTRNNTTHTRRPSRDQDTNSKHQTRVTRTGTNRTKKGAK